MLFYLLGVNSIVFFYLTSYLSPSPQLSSSYKIGFLLVQIKSWIKLRAQCWGLTRLFCWRPGTWQRGRSEQPVAFVSSLPLRLLVGWLVSSLYGGSRALLLHSPGGFMLHWRPGRQRLLCPWPTKCVSDHLALTLSVSVGLSLFPCLWCIPSLFLSGWFEFFFFSKFAVRQKKVLHIYHLMKEGYILISLLT